MKYIVVDVESDGPILGHNSMVCFGAVVLDWELKDTFYGQTAPISPFYNEEALSISGFSRKEHESFQSAKLTMIEFKNWLKQKGRVTLLSDNNGYDASWINWYFHTYLGENPFGWSSRRIGDWFAGFYNDSHYKWKKHRIKVHDHNPVNDAIGNAQAVQYLIKQGFKLKI